MIYTEFPSDGYVTIQMTRDDYATLLMILGYACAAARTPDEKVWVLTFVNELNRTNPAFRPYALPEL